MTTFISELRRRNVLRAAAAYGLVTWIIIEAGSVLLPTFGAPEGAFQIYVIVVFSGYVLSLIFSWIFERTPDGVKLDRDIDRSAPVDAAYRQKTNFVIIGLLVVALTVSITFNVTGIREDKTHFQANSELKSIAVLPFQNRGGDSENSNLADGIHDTVLTTLSNNPSLIVISQNSVMRYRDTTKDTGDIGEELGVDTILQGTVQQVGDAVRINVKLVDVNTDANLWTHSYVKKLAMHELFEFQSEISSSISSELRLALSPEVEQRIPTSNLIAWNRYTEARNDMAKRQLLDALSARRKFEEAIALDPAFAEAYAGLATSILLLYINDNAVERDEAFAVSQAALDKALALNPELADAYAALGLLKLRIWIDTRIGNENEQAAIAFSRAIELQYNHASAYMWFASLREAEQDISAAIELYEKSLEFDPLGRIPYANLPGLYAQLGQNDEALRLWIRATEIHPDWPTPYQYIAVHLNNLGRPDEALAWYDQALTRSSAPIEAGNLSVAIYLEFGEIDRAKKALQQLPQSHPLADMTEGLVLLIDHDVQGALGLLLAAHENRPSRPPFVYDIISNVALLAGELDTASRFVLLTNPVLASDAELVIDKYTVRNVVQLAYIAQKQGDPQTAYALLSDALPFVQSRPRLGMGGHGILDVQIFALLGRTDDAISAFREAVDLGFRSSLSYNFWLIDDDPYLASIRDDQRFLAIRDLVATDIQRMRDNAVLAQDSGNWESLRQIAIQSAASDTQASLRHRGGRR